jgi:hypothetical protein
MNFHAGILGFDFALVLLEVIGVEIADVDGFGTVVGEMMS